jgi:hypothetical protein
LEARDAVIWILCLYFYHNISFFLFCGGGGDAMGCSFQGQSAWDSLPYKFGFALLVILLHGILGLFGSVGVMQT